jgi:hypothetical protein
VAWSNHYPLRVSFVSPPDGSADSPSSQRMYPSWSIGWLDHSAAEFNATLGLGGGSPPPPFQVQPGLPLNAIAATVGSNHYAYEDFFTQLQTDPSRLWLYNGNNPGSGFNGPTYLQIYASAIADAVGAPVMQLPVLVTLTQGATQIMRTTIIQNDGLGNLSSAPLNFGSILTSPFTVRIQPQQPLGAPGIRAAGYKTVGAAPLTFQFTQPAPGPGQLTFDALVLGTLAAGTQDVPDILPPPPGLTLTQPSPNPFRYGARADYAIGQQEHVRAGVYDLSGRRIRMLGDEDMASGRYNLIWDGKDQSGREVATGVYYLKVEIPGSAQSRKMLLMR